MRADRRIHDVIDEAPVDTLRFRQTLGQYASGITVIAGFHDDAPVGFTCQAFSSLSASPPLISFNVMNSSTSYPKLRESGRFSVNVLAHNQHTVSNQFASKGVDKWAGIGWDLTRHGNPVIDETLMWLDCELFAEYEGGDHTIVVGKVLEMSPADWHQGEPLLYFRGKYRALTAAEH
jgi:3-hydroxy-9,10-secoandrosta-1,3,5(10)-triene-9,17-dione monooxygenase reductase component